MSVKKYFDFFFLSEISASSRVWIISSHTTASFTTKSGFEYEAVRYTNRSLVFQLNKDDKSWISFKWKYLRPNQIQVLQVQCLIHNHNNIPTVQSFFQINLNNNYVSAFPTDNEGTVLGARCKYTIPDSAIAAITVNKTEIKFEDIVLILFWVECISIKIFRAY